MKMILFLILFPLPVFAGIHANNFWSRREVTACFAKGETQERRIGENRLKVRDWKKSNMDKVRRWILEEFSPERTGIHFTGLRECEEMPNAEIIIFFNKNNKLLVYFFEGFHGLSLIGPHRDKVEGYPAASGFVSISSSGLFKGNIIHEFGHTASLMHEHIHPNGLKLHPRECIYLKPNQKPIPGLYYGSYDPLSIMNYCQVLGPEGLKAGLSQKDVEFLKMIYP